MAGEDKKLGIRSAETIPHGIDLSIFRPSDEPVSDRLIFVGRISPQKGVLEAVRIAQAANQKLDIVGRIRDKDMEYWNGIEPYIDGEQIRFLGPKSQPEVARLFSRAKALIFPTQISEAFGLVTVEAQACGTPVIINDIGASRELIDNDKTGFLVGSEAEYMEAINNIGTIDRNDCRQFAQRFDLNEMADSYDRLYERLIASPQQLS
jgi:glycosyltransferase involved in cell wall biosynthesis